MVSEDLIILTAVIKNMVIYKKVTYLSISYIFILLLAFNLIKNGLNTNKITVIASGKLVINIFNNYY